MGVGGSKQAQLEKFGQLFSPKEREVLHDTFVTISGSQEAVTFEEKQLKEYIRRSTFTVPQDTVHGLFKALSGISQNRQQQQQITFGDFVLNASHMLKGSSSSQDESLKAALLCKLCAGKSNALTFGQLQATLFSLLSVVLTSECALKVFQYADDFEYNSESSQRLATTLLKSLHKKQSEGSGPSSVDEAKVSPGDMERWLYACPLAAQIFDITLAFFFYRDVLSSDKSSIPLDIQNYLGIATNPETREAEPERLLLPVQIQHPLYTRQSFKSQLLDRSSLVLLNSYLPVELRGRLYPLFSSTHHGESFSTFCKLLVGCKGPTLLVVRDKGGSVFGGFAAVKWDFNAQFTGNSNCFLFRLSPEMDVYVPSGYNNNYMYLEHNAQTLPNGLGMGGQVDYFGLWLSADYGSGHSKAKPRCTTYSSPMLSSSEEFEVELLELWGVGPPVLPEKEEGTVGSILDKDKAASHLLEMAGKTLHSQGLREPENDGETT